MLISIHIPKTGGETFKSLLKSRFGEHYGEDYEGAITLATCPLRSSYWKCRFNLIHSFRTKNLPGGCLHGHFLGVKYRAYLRKAKFAAWFRNPVDRVVSHFEYWRRAEAMEIEIWEKVRSGDISLEQFVEIPEFQNTQYYFVKGIGVDNLDFVGITERFDQSLMLFDRILGFTADENERVVERENFNPSRMTGAYTLKDELRDKIEKLNCLDMEIYKQALDRHLDLCLRHGVDQDLT